MIFFLEKSHFQRITFYIFDKLIENLICRNIIYTGYIHILKTTRIGRQQNGFRLVNRGGFPDVCNGNGQCQNGTSCDPFPLLHQNPPEIDQADFVVRGDHRRIKIIRGRDLGLILFVFFHFVVQGVEIDWYGRPPPLLSLKKRLPSSDNFHAGSEQPFAFPVTLRFHIASELRRIS